MQVKEVQDSIDMLGRAMMAKGLAKPKAAVWFDSFVEPRVSLHWEDMSKPEHTYRTVSKYFRGDALDALLAGAAEFVDDLPSPEEAKLRDFMSALGNVIDLGRKHGIEVSYVNPLVETMKRLSENALTHNPA